MTNETILRLVYVSRNVLGDDPLEHEHQVEQILAASRRNNAPLGITGALLFNRDCFAQTLEGPSAAVEALFEKIQWDSRHTDSVVLQACPVTGREFGNWSMAYAGRHDAAGVRFDALTADSSAERNEIGAGHVLDLLRGVIGRAAPGLSIPAM